MLDIKTMEHEEVTELKFSDRIGFAAILSKDDDTITIQTLDADNEMELGVKEDAEALIKALKYAIEKDWFTIEEDL